MRYLTTILTAILLPLSLVTGCSTDRTDAAAKGEGEEMIVPELKDRAPGLDAGDWSQVERRYEESRNVLIDNPKDVDAMIAVAQVFMYEARVTGDHPYYYPAAERMLDRALAIDPDRYEGVITKAAVLLSLHRFEEARAMADRAVALAPNAAAPWGALVDAHVELGNLKEAVEAADRMMAIRPDLKSYARVSYLRELHGDSDGAIEAMKLAVEAGAPGSEEKAWARTTLGDIYYNLDRIADAEREYLLTVAERKDYPFALAGLAKVRYVRGEEEAALRTLDTAIALVPEFSFVEVQADIHRAEGRDRVADSLVDVISGMLAEDEASGHSMNLEIARLYASHDRNLREAVRRARVEVEARPSSAEALDALAWALFRAGEEREAKKMIDRAHLLAPRNGLILAHAGYIDLALGNRVEGEKKMRMARELRPRMPIGLGGEKAVGS